MNTVTAANGNKTIVHTRVWKIENLVPVGAGETDDLLRGDIGKPSDSYLLMADLDFTSDTDYRDATDQSINADDAARGGIKAALTKKASGDKGDFNLGTLKRSGK